MRRKPIADKNFEGFVAVERSVDLGRIHPFDRGLKLGIDRYVFIERDGDFVRFSVGSDQSKLELFAVHRDGWTGKGVEDIGHKTLSVNTSGEEWGGWALNGSVSVGDGQIAGNLKLTLKYFPSIKFAFNLKLVGWVAPPRLNGWKNV